MTWLRKRLNVPLMFNGTDTSKIPRIHGRPVTRKGEVPPHAPYTALGAFPASRMPRSVSTRISSSPPTTKNTIRAKIAGR